MRTLPLIALPFVLVAGIATAAVPELFAKSQPGLWELSGIEGARVPSRTCIGDLAELARVEHRDKDCKPKVLRQSATSAAFGYECSSKDFGRTEISFVTPRNFKIVSQGIAGGLPFAHSVQARRIGDCTATAAPSRH